ncbi:MAG: SDR family oxidoreductase [Thermoproteota archaeon]|nr:SDR family oxidoreductase [Thermoproteota archaeon]
MVSDGVKNQIERVRHKEISKDNNSAGDTRNERKVAVVTGSSSGIGYATVLRLARSGYFTFATMRHKAKGLDLAKVAENEDLRIQIEQLDVTDDISIKGAIDRIHSTMGRIDVLVNNAGYSLVGSLENLSMKQIQEQLDTNLLGNVRVTGRVLPVMRKQRSGTIVNVSSVMGRLGIPGFSIYAASKFALEGLTESLAYEVEPFGIRVILIEPAVVKTKMFNNAAIGQDFMQPDSPYHDLLVGVNAKMKAWMESASTPEEVAETMLQAITSSDPNLRYPIGLTAADLLKKRKAMTDQQFQEYMENSMINPPSSPKVIRREGENL